jgi:hypothetical protein
MENKGFNIDILRAEIEKLSAFALGLVSEMDTKDAPKDMVKLMKEKEAQLKTSLEKLKNIGK